MAWGLRRKSLPGAVLALLGGGLLYRGMTGHCSLYQTLGITDEDAGVTSTPLSRAVRGEASTTIDQPVERVYQFWRDIPNLALVAPGVCEVCVDSESGQSLWLAQGPRGQTFEWEAELTDDNENERIAWRTIGTSDLPHEGEVRFRPVAGDHGPPAARTEVHLSLRCRLPFGAAGAALAKALHASPDLIASDMLQNAKAVLEAGVGSEEFTGGSAEPSAERDKEALVDKALEMSFPASDPPSFAGGCREH